MQLTPDQLERALQEGITQGATVVRNDKNRITREINRILTENNVEKTTYTVQLKINIKVDMDEQKIEVVGGYSAPRANMVENGQKLTISIEDPNQPELIPREPLNDVNAEFPGNDEEPESPGEETNFGDDE